MVVEPLAREFGPVFGLSQDSTLFLARVIHQIQLRSEGKPID